MSRSEEDILLPSTSTMSYSALPSEQVPLTTRSSEDNDGDAASPPPHYAHVSDAATKQGKTTRSTSRSQVDWLTYASILSLFIVAINLLLLQSGYVSQKQDAQANGPVDLASLPRPNAYIGLERLVRNSSSPSYPLTREQYPDVLGTLHVHDADRNPYNHSHVHLNGKHSLLLQFKVRDYGLESCAIQSYFPEVGARNVTLEGLSKDLLVYLTEASTDSFLNEKQLSWGTKPRRTRLIGTLNATNGVNSTTPFWHCPSRSVQTVEILCSTAECNVEFLQNRRKPRLGFWLFQSEISTPAEPTAE